MIFQESLGVQLFPSAIKQYLWVKALFKIIFQKDFFAEFYIPLPR